MRLALAGRIDRIGGWPLRLAPMSMDVAKSSFRSGLVTALPIALGYFPIAFSFGVGATKAGLSPYEAVAASALMFSGAAQFMAIALIAD